MSLFKGFDGPSPSGPLKCWFLPRLHVFLVMLKRGTFIENRWESKGFDRKLYCTELRCFEDRIWHCDFLYGILHEIIYYRLFKPDGGRFQPNVDYHIFQVVVKNRHIGLPFKRMTDCPISRMYTTQHTHEMKFLNTPFQRSQSAVFYFLDRIFPENWPFLKIFGFMRGNGACLFSKDIGDQSYWLLPFVTNVIQGSIRNMSVCFLKERCVILIVLSGVLFQHLEIVVVIFVDPDYMDVSKNNGTPKSSILIGCSIINHPFWGTPIFGNVHVVFSFMTRWSAPFLDPDIFVKKVSLSLWW